MSWESAGSQTRWSEPVHPSRFYREEGSGRTEEKFAHGPTVDQQWVGLGLGSSCPEVRAWPDAPSSAASPREGEHRLEQARQFLQPLTLHDLGVQPHWFCARPLHPSGKGITHRPSCHHTCAEARALLPG